MERVRGKQMTARDQMLMHVRSSLGRTAKAPVPDPPPVRIELPAPVDRVAQFTAALEALAGKVTVVANLAAAKQAVDQIVAGRSFIDRYEQNACATAEFGINTADYALADTGSLVFLSESGESRLISLLPPRHIAIVAKNKILSGLDELFSLVPQPAAKSSSMVIITGPSRTADIEMRLVRGVHGPGEIHVMIVEVVTP